MITFEELNKRVEKEFENDAIVSREWDRKKDRLIPHQEYDSEELVSFFTTSIDELADFCWLCGCNLSCVLDYWDGSPTYTVSMPTTEEEYQENLKEAADWWKEVM